MPSRAVRVRSLLISAVISAALLLGATASASAGTLDQQQTTTNGAYGLYPGQNLAQTFTPAITGELDRADLLLSGSGSEDVTVEIRTTSAGSPTATVLATGTIAGSAIEDTPAFLPVTFATPALVTAGTQYALVVYANASGDSHGWDVQSGGDPYAGGQLLYSNDYPPPPGASWTPYPGSGDTAFKTYVNRPPTITSSSTYNAPENQTAAGTITSSDPDGDTPSYSISGGADAGTFSINASSGALSFQSDPNFEAPTDTGANNVYDVTVQVSDGNGGSDTKAIKVTVTDVSEAGPPQTTPPTQAGARVDPKCVKLRKKLHDQKQKLAEAKTESKRSAKQAHIADSKQRLKKLGC